MSESDRPSKRGDSSSLGSKNCRNNKNDHNHNRRRKPRSADRPSAERPKAVVFPPDARETGTQVVNRIFQAFGLDDDFPKDCQEYMAELLNKDGNIDTEGLVDMTDKPFITIDGDHTTDLDQAMWISRSNYPLTFLTEKSSRGSTTARFFRVSYALADAAFYVPFSSPLFQHALNKSGSSFYLPGKSLPMLPRALSEHRMSLNEGVKRRCLVFDMYLDAEGHVVETTYDWCVIQSRWKGTYRKTQEYYDSIDAGEKHSFSDKPFRETLDLLRDVGSLRIRLAEERGVIVYDRTHSHVAMDDRGKLMFSRGSRFICELYNEQIGLLVNSEGAKILEEKEGGKNVIHPIYRSQSGPSNDKLDTLEAIICNTLESHGVATSSWGWNRQTTTLASFLDTLRTQKNAQPVGSREHQKWEAIIKVVERQAMLTNSKAVFTPSPEDGHHGLKITHYARFSSPMRELIGCFTHKVLWEGHNGDYASSDMSAEDDMALRDKVIRAARRAKALQKQLSGSLHLHLLNLTFYKDLRKHLPRRSIYSGLLMGMDFSEKRNKSRRCYVQLDEPSVEIKVQGEDLDYHFGCRYGPVGETFGHSSSTVAIGPLPGSFKDDAADECPPVFRSGQKVSIMVGDYAEFYGQTSRSRWIFIMDTLEKTEEEEVVEEHEEEEIPPARKLSMLRNSIVDRDLLLDLLADVSDYTLSSES